MARPTIFKHPKFLRLCHELRLPEPHALGHLEYLWASAYESGKALIGDAVDVELAAKWTGEPGTLAEALVRLRFLDKTNDGLEVHDLYDHAPEYVKKRADRETARQAQGLTLREVRAKAAKARWEGGKGAIGEQTAANGSRLQTNGEQTAASGEQTALLPHPHPHPHPKTPQPPLGGEGGQGEPSANRPRKRAAGAVLPEVPPELATPEFQAAWGDWLAHRNELRKPVTPTAARNALAQLLPLGPTAAAAAIRHSLAMGWQGIFPQTGGANAPTSPPAPRATPAEIAQREQAEQEADAQRASAAKAAALRRAGLFPQPPTEDKTT